MIINRIQRCLSFVEFSRLTKSGIVAGMGLFLYAIFLSDQVLDLSDLSREKFFLTRQYIAAYSRLMRMENEAIGLSQREKFYQEKMKMYALPNKNQFTEGVASLVKQYALRKYMIRFGEEAKMPCSTKEFFLSTQGDYKNLIDFLHEVIQRHRFISLNQMELIKQNNHRYELTAEFEWAAPITWHDDKVNFKEGL